MSQFFCIWLLLITTMMMNVFVMNNCFAEELDDLMDYEDAEDVGDNFHRPVFIPTTTKKTATTAATTATATKGNSNGKLQNVSQRNKKVIKESFIERNQTSSPVQQQQQQPQQQLPTIPRFSRMMKKSTQPTPRLFEYNKTSIAMNNNNETIPLTRLATTTTTLSSNTMTNLASPAIINTSTTTSSTTTSPPLSSSKAFVGIKKMNFPTIKKENISFPTSLIRNISMIMIMDRNSSKEISGMQLLSSVGKQCPLGREPNCAHKCELFSETDENGCNTCKCCPVKQFHACKLNCTEGYATNERGCPLCRCV